ncbi:BTAD domain-containing putative transcriptional regulator [Streptomyces sp. NPDC047108]|uniref:BTAD domain-containing putative transcriptional regulator n=1 Tax=Streptomyces sp. NPDC047108 TaxID=3155025 RepID=UPI00340082E2
MRFGLLGPVEAWHENSALELGPPKRRVLLIRLLLENGRPVSVSRLCKDLWDGRQSSGTVSSLHAHISRLRSVLEPERISRGRSTMLVSGSAGYSLRVPAEARDSVRFEDLVNSTQESVKQGRTDEAGRRLDAALQLWRGPALSDAAEYGFAAQYITRLHATRQLAEELHATILIEQGQLEQAISVARQLTETMPLREMSWSLLMRALYGAGRSAEALQHYESFRTMLAEDLGVDPGPALRELHLAILRHDTAAIGGPRRRPPVTLRGPAEAGSPPMVGRSEETARLGMLLDAASAGRTQWAVVSGAPGSGKSRLLEEFASRAEETGFAVAWARSCHAIGDTGAGDPVFHPAAQLLDSLRRAGRLMDNAVRPGSSGFAPRSSGFAPRSSGFAPRSSGFAPSAPADGGAPEAAPASPGTDPARSSDDAVVRDLTTALMEGPTVCVLDDVGRAGSDVLHLLHQFLVVLRDAPVLVVCTVRDAEAPEVAGLLAELARHGAARMHLGPLSVPDVEELLSLRGSGAGGGPDEAAALRHRSEGNPFVLNELLTLPPGRRTGPAAQVPASVGSVVRARFAELESPVRTLLVNAAVDGEHLDIELLAAVQNLSLERLLLLVDAAEKARFLVWDEDGSGSGNYRFPDLLRETVLSTLSPAARQLRHQSHARFLSTLPGRHPVRIADHLAAAGPLIPADAMARAALRSGRHCADRGRTDAALLWFERAAMFGSDHPTLRDEALRAARRIEPDRCPAQLQQL